MDLLMTLFFRIWVLYKLYREKIAQGSIQTNYTGRWRAQLVENLKYFTSACLILLESYQKLVQTVLMGWELFKTAHQISIKHSITQQKQVSTLSQPIRQAERRLYKLGTKDEVQRSAKSPQNNLFWVVFRRVTVHFIYFLNQVCDIYNQFCCMKDNKENAKQSMIKMYNVADFYQIIEKVGRGTYGSVYKAKGLKDGRFYAIKKLENNDTKLQQEGFPITALREISLLKQIDHPNIIKLKEIIVSRPNKRNLFRGSTFLVFEYMDHDFAGLFKMKSKFSLPQIKCIIAQLLEGVAYLHRNKIFHRDIKSANILLNDQGEVKLADFGLGRKVRFQNFFTYKVVTLWYRAPQLLLGSKSYSDKIDVWSVGCVVAEFFTGEVLFKKQTQYSQMERIYEIVGDFEANEMKINEQSYKIYQNLQDLRPRKTYSKEIANYLKKTCPNISETTIDFIDRLLRLDPNKRMSCEQALRHPFFSEKPLACNKNQIQKMEYQCHQMFKDRSIKIQRFIKNDEQNQGKMTKFKQIRENRDTKEYRERERQPQDRKYSRNYRDDKQYRERDNKGRQNRYYYENKKNQKYRSSDDKSSYQKKSETYSSSSKTSQYSSSSLSRSRHRAKEDNRKSRDSYKGNRDRDYSRRDDKRRVDRKDERRDSDKFQRQRKGDYERKDKYYKGEKDQRYSNYRRKDDRVQSKRQYRDERVPFKKDSKVQERRDDKDEKQRKDEKREDRKEYREKKEDWKRDSKQRKYQRSEKAGYQSRGGKYYEDRDYKRRQQKWVQKSKADEVKYQESQKHGDYYRKEDVSQKKLDNKYYYVSGKDPYRKKDYRNSNSSSRSSNHRYKKDREYSRKPITYQRKNHYKKSHSDSNDHRNH